MMGATTKLLGARVHPNLCHYHRTGGPLLSHRPYQHIVGRVAVSLIASAAYQFFLKKNVAGTLATLAARSTWPLYVGSRWIEMATERGFATVTSSPLKR